MSGAQGYRAALDDFLEEIVALVVHDDERGEILDFDLPDRFHAELGVFENLDGTNAVLRESGGHRQLCFNFDLRLSNAGNQPAFIVLLHRFAESIRERKVAPTSANLETGQPLQITAAPEIPVEISAIDLAGKPVPLSAATRNAPRVPGFLTAKQDDTTLLDAAVFFADTREADFSQCGKSGTTGASNPATIERHTQPDPLWRVWILLLIAALLVSWKFTAGRASA